MKTKTSREINKGLKSIDRYVLKSLLLRDQFSPKLIYKLNAIPIKMPEVCFIVTDKGILKVAWKCKRPSVVIFRDQYWWVREFA